MDLIMLQETKKYQNFAKLIACLIATWKIISDTRECYLIA